MNLIIKPFQIEWIREKEAFDMYEQSPIVINTNYIIETKPFVFQPLNTIMLDVNKNICMVNYETFLKDDKGEILTFSTMQQIIMSNGSEYLCFIMLSQLIDKQN